MHPSLRPYFLAAGLLFSFSAIAQKNFQNGYVILPSKDTLQGQIDYREWNNNPHSIVFRNAQGSTSEYTPDALAGFGVNGERYEGWTVRFYPYSMNPVLASDENFDTHPYDKPVFLRSITRGTLNLYMLRDSTGDDYFFAGKAGQRPEQLRVVSRRVDQDGHTGVQFDEVYKRQLTRLLADCGSVSGQIGRTAYKEAALRKLFFSYSHCGKDTVEARGVRNGEKDVQVGPIAGFFTSKLKGRSGSQYDFPSSYSSFTGGIGALFLLPRNRQQLGFYVDMLYGRQYWTGGPYALNNYERIKNTIEYNELKIDILFRYRFVAKKVRPFLDLGVANKIVMGNKNRSETYNTLDNSNSTGPLFNIAGSGRSFEFGFAGGAGVQTGHFSLEARAEQVNGPSDVLDIGLPVTSFYFLVSYAF